MRTKRVNLKKMIAKNPNVDRVQLMRSLTVLRELKKAGVVAHTYSLSNRRSMFVTQNVFVARNFSNGQRYSPVRIQGKPLSSTILRDRGSN
jgi:hypothetical protein